MALNHNIKKNIMDKLSLNERIYKIDCQDKNCVCSGILKDIDNLYYYVIMPPNWSLYQVENYCKNMHINYTGIVTGKNRKEVIKKILFNENNINIFECGFLNQIIFNYHKRHNLYNIHTNIFNYEYKELPENLNRKEAFGEIKKILKNTFEDFKDTEIMDENYFNKTIDDFMIIKKII